MRIEYPHFLWLLLVLPPALAAFFWWATRQREKLAAQFIEARLLPALTVGLSPVRQKIRFACLVFAVAFLIIALARPQWGFNWEEIKRRGLDIVVAIDTSKSMLATDIPPNRLARAKLAALDLMQQAKADRLGLVAFAGNAFLECPLTIDDTAFRQSVETLDVNTLPQGGTAIAEAIKTALTAFKEGDSHKVLVLFTDGEDNDTGALEEAQNAAKEGLKIFTIGIGTAEGDLLRVTEANGNSDYVRDEQGNVVKSHLNEALLQQIAGATEGGFYLPLRGAKTIDTLYERGLAPLPKTEGKEKLVKRYHEKYHWPLAAAIVLLLAEMLLPQRKRVNGFKVQSPKSEVKTTAAAMLMILLLPAVGNASPASAMKSYSSGQFTNALVEYERLLNEQSRQQKPEDPRLQFNAGAAAYRATNHTAAIQHFTAVLAARDVKLQQAAYYNLGNTHFRLGQEAKDLDAMEESWKTAIKAYQNAVALDKTDPDAAYNLAFVKHIVDQIAQLREAARRAKEAADDSVRRNQYHRALEIMEQLLQTNPTAKPFQEFVKRLKDIDEIVTPHQP